MPEQTILTKPASLASRAFNNPFLMLALAGLLWSGNHIAGRAAAGHVPPVSLASLRWLLAAALLCCAGSGRSMAGRPLSWQCC